MDEKTEFEARLELGRKIKLMRENPRKGFIRGQKLTGQRLATEALDQSQGSVGNYETGKRLPKIDALKKLCNFLGYEIAEALPENHLLRQSLYQQWQIQGMEGFFENTDYKNSESLVNSNSEERRVEVIYSTALIPGQFATGQLIRNLKKTIEITLQEFSATAFAVVYTGSAMGEILEHQQPIILDQVDLKNGDLCMLRKDDGFMLCVFEAESPFGKVYRMKGAQQKVTIASGDNCLTYKVLAIKNASDIL